jgi:hypothetical protein
MVLTSVHAWNRRGFLESDPNMDSAQIDAPFAYRKIGLSVWDTGQEMVSLVSLLGELGKKLGKTFDCVS